MLKHAFAAALVVCAACAPARAGNLHSAAGAHATVGARYAAQFQALIDDLEAHGARVLFMGGIRPGRCGPAHKHPCGMALDVCQRGRNVVDTRCHMPGPAVENDIAEHHGLFHGARWCDADRGHFEAGGSVACGHEWGAKRGTRYANRNARR